MVAKRRATGACENPKMATLLPQDLRICSGTEADLPLILSFIRKLADYEKLTHEVVVDEQTLRESLFGHSAAAEVVLAYLDREPVGFAVYFRNFSTFSGRPGIYLEDLFVEPAHRSKGIGTALLIYLAKIAVERGYARVNWAVLDWNQPAIDFYKKLGAVLLDDWTVCRLSGEPLKRLANRDTNSHTL
jgi:GNAT superfamily N-acetyltransferase